MKILFIAFNYGNAGSIVNGPGICLFNLCSFIERNKFADVKIFTNIKSQFNNSNFVYEKSKVLNYIKDADIIHYWSGINNENLELIKYANLLNKKVIIGPNLLDGVEEEKEIKLLASIKYSLMLVVNENIKYNLIQKYNLNIKKVRAFIVGPDIKLWKLDKEKNNRVLWKGNEKHIVKDIQFAKEVSSKLLKYGIDTDFLTSYNYFNHIGIASKYSLYFSTSLSETMGMTLAEQWSAGTPSVTHPKIYLHGENYKTGIITNRDTESYVNAICEIMSNKNLLSALICGARDYCEEHFSEYTILKKYQSLLEIKYES